MFIFDSFWKRPCNVRQSSTAPWTRTAWDYAEAHFVPKIGGWGDLLSLIEFNDCSMSEEEVGGSVRYEVWVFRHSSATNIAALQQHWLLIDSPAVDVWEPQPPWLGVRGRGHRNRQTFMGDDSLQISQSVQRHSGWQWALPWNWRSQQPAFIPSGLFSQLPDSVMLLNVSKHPPKPILPKYVTLIRKYFQRISW